MDIGSHSWDHVHHALPRQELSWPSRERDDFALVDTFDGAEKEIHVASQFIETAHRQGSRRSFRTFPFNHTNDYLVNQYLPRT